MKENKNPNNRKVTIIILIIIAIVTLIAGITLLILGFMENNKKTDETSFQWSDRAVVNEDVTEYNISQQKTEV